VATRSAVSSSVNLLIWSTIVDILGLLEAAAVDSHLRCRAYRFCVRKAARDVRTVERREERQEQEHCLTESLNAEVIAMGRFRRKVK